MVSFLIFVRDALIAVLLSWVGIEIGRQQDKPEEPAPENTSTSIMISRGLTP